MAAKQKILIVDDDNNIAELISLYLPKECFDTRIVNDGEEAMIAFDQYNPNLILLDLMLPGMDGYQVCREIRAKANVPIICCQPKARFLTRYSVWSSARTIHDEAIRLQGACRARQGSAAPLSAVKAGGTCCRVKMRQVHGSGGQSLELLRHLHGAGRRHAAKGTGTFIFPCGFAESGFYKRAASGSHLGL